MAFSDKCLCKKQGSDGKQYVHLRLGEESTPVCKVSTLKSSGGLVMVWGVYSVNDPRRIVTWQGSTNMTTYIDKLIEHFLFYFDRNLGNNSILTLFREPWLAKCCQLFLVIYSRHAGHIKLIFIDYSQITILCHLRTGNTATK